MQDGTFQRATNFLQYCSEQSIAKVIRDLRMHYGFPRIEMPLLHRLKFPKLAKICSENLTFQNHLIN